MIGEFVKSHPFKDEYGIVIKTFVDDNRNLIYYEVKWFDGIPIYGQYTETNTKMMVDNFKEWADDRVIHP
jgi:hypothetical protein